MGLKTDVCNVLNPIILRKDTEGVVRDHLQSLFEFRNSIVHEIDFSTIGPWIVRNSIEVDEARNMGATVRSVIEAIETEINRLGPRGFPNRLDSKFLPEDELEYLEQEIRNLENKISAAILSYRADTGRNINDEDWSAALLASRASLQGEMSFISNADFIVTRHFDFKRPLRLALLKQRLDYLQLLQQEVE